MPTLTVIPPNSSQPKDVTCQNKLTALLMEISIYSGGEGETNQTKPNLHHETSHTEFPKTDFHALYRRKKVRGWGSHITEKEAEAQVLNMTFLKSP